MKVKRVVSILSMVFAIMSLASCGLLNDLFAKDLTLGNIDSAITTKAGTYNVAESFDVNATWIIEAGTKFIMAPGTEINVNLNGQIIANGTDAKKITFTSSKPTPAANDWYGIDDYGSGSKYVYCVFEYTEAGLYLDGSLVTVTNCTFNTNKYGLYAIDVDSVTAINNNAFTSNIDYPFLFNATFNIDDTSVFTSNTKQRAYYNGAAVSVARTWGITSVPIDMEYSFDIDAVLTLLPGVTLVMFPNTEINVNSIGKIIADGTSTKKIKFTSSKPTPDVNAWYGFDVYGSSCSFTYCTIEYASVGIYIEDSGSIPTIANSSILSCATGVWDNLGVWVDPGTNVYTGTTIPVYITP